MSLKQSAEGERAAPRTTPQRPSTSPTRVNTLGRVVLAWRQGFEITAFVNAIPDIVHSAERLRG
jgi:hypothetical protein